MWEGVPLEDLHHRSSRSQACQRELVEIPLDPAGVDVEVRRWGRRPDASQCDVWVESVSGEERAVPVEAPALGDAERSLLQEGTVVGKQAIHERPEGVE